MKNGINLKIQIDNGKFNFTKEEFFSIVEKSKEMIRAGDIFQILISNRFTQQAVVDSLSFYRALRSKNPSPYLFLLEFEDFSIAGSSNYRDWETDRKSTRLNSSHRSLSRMPSSA